MSICTPRFLGEGHPMWTSHHPPSWLFVVCPDGHSSPLGVLVGHPSDFVFAYHVRCRQACDIDTPWNVTGSAHWVHFFWLSLQDIRGRMRLGSTPKLWSLLRLISSYLVTMNRLEVIHKYLLCLGIEYVLIDWPVRWRTLCLYSVCGLLSALSSHQSLPLPLCLFLSFCFHAVKGKLLEPN